jgi:hypothetical protein
MNITCLNCARSYLDPTTEPEILFCAKHNKTALRICPAFAPEILCLNCRKSTKCPNANLSKNSSQAVLHCSTFEWMPELL